MAVATVFFLLAASSFQRWFPKAFSLCFHFVGSKWIHGLLFVIEKKKTRQNKKYLFPHTLPQHTRRKPPERTDETKHFCSKPGRLAELAALPTATWIMGPAEKYANWQTGYIWVVYNNMFLVLSLSSSPRARSTEVASGGPGPAVSVILTASGVALLAERHSDCLPISLDELIMQVDEGINILTGKHLFHPQWHNPAGVKDFLLGWAIKER